MTLTLTLNRETPTDNTLYDRSANLLLTEQVRETLDIFLDLLRQKASDWNVPVSQTEVRGIPASDEMAARLLITQQVGISEKKALEYWNEVGDTVQAWTDTLSPEAADIVLDFISVEVWWDAAEPSL